MPYLHEIHIIHSVEMISRQDHYILNVRVLGILQESTKFIRLKFKLRELNNRVEYH